MKERILSRMLQRAVGRCETVQERELTASGAGFVNEFCSSNEARMPRNRLWT